jgi:hypothetical protein
MGLPPALAGSASVFGLPSGCSRGRSWP